MQPAQEHTQLNIKAANVVVARLDTKQLRELCKHKLLPYGFMSAVYQAKAQLVKETQSSCFGLRVDELKIMLDE